MTRPPMTRTGGCNCGAVRLALHGAPTRVGLCHCLTCRRATGSAFMAFAVWDRAHVVITGETACWTDTTDDRHFCPHCGSQLFATGAGDEVEVRIGCLDDAPTSLLPSYELWVVRREAWQPPLPGAEQHGGNREG